MPTRRQDCDTARKFGAEGIGLCRTEHMFFEAEAHHRRAPDDPGRRPEDREAALAKLLPMQRGDFEEIFKVMAGLPVTIRLLDPPLHEFLPHSDEEFEEVAKAAGTDPAKLRARAIALHEANPMLGHRGCRLGITYPEIYEMQARAILEAALDVLDETGKAVELEIMIPLVGFSSELDFLKARIEGVAAKHRRRTRQAPAIPDRHHDRAAARRAHGRRHRAKRRSSSPSAPTISPRPRSASAATTPRSS